MMILQSKPDKIISKPIHWILTIHSNHQTNKNLKPRIQSSKSCTFSTNNAYHLYNASTDTIRQTVIPTSPQELKDAVHKSIQAQHNWSTNFSPMERCKILQRASEMFNSPSSKIMNDLIQIETLDTGRPIKEIKTYDIIQTSDCLSFHGGLVATHGYGQYHDLGNQNIAYTKREPIGVTVGIGSWNYPLVGAVTKSAPALAFGNSMLFKPSPLTPNSAFILSDIYKEAGVPDGVFQVIVGGGEIGSMLVNHPDVGKVSFTGSVETGRKIYEMAASSFKSVTLELGGKSPLIIFENCNLEDAVTAAMVANWYSNGQVCSNGTRVFVHESIIDEFLDRLIEKTRNLKIGDPLEDDTDIGPMVSRDHMEQVLRYIDIGKHQDKATLLYGGERLSNRKGYFLSPAIFVDCKDDMQIVQEEVFGMLMCVMPFRDEEEVISRANASKYGLAAGIFTNDIKQGHRVASSLQTGMIWINNYNLGPIQLPWGGYKHSGVGRENGIYGLDWTRNKSVYIEMNYIENPFRY